MRADESETGNGVIERSGVPTFGGVAVGTIGGSEARAGSGVNGIGGLLPFCEVTAGVAAIRGSNLQIVIIVEMAGSARHIGVTIGEQEARCAVVKDRSVPTDGVVAIGAIGGGEGRTRRRVRRIGGLLPVGEMAVLAGAGSQIVIVVDVALLARNVGVAVRERESRSAVIKFCSEPAVKTVTALAVGRGERGTGLGVIGVGSVLPVFQVT